MRLLIATLLLATAAPLGAQERTVTWYDVEIIVFRHLDARTSETWPPDAGVPDVSELVPLFPPDTGKDADNGNDSDVVTAGLADGSTPLHPGMPVPYVPLEASARQLNGVYGSLRRSSRYEPLLHVAWTQPPLAREQAPQLRLTLPGALTPPRAEDEDITNEQPLLGRMNDDDSSLSAPKNEDAPAFLGEEETRASTLARPLDGLVQLSVSRYLHLDLDLIYLPEDINPELVGNIPVATREWTEEEQRERDQRRRQILDALARGDLTLEEAEILALEPEQQVFEGFRLNQYRRLRSRELHYFDHPVYGAIVTVTPRQVSARMLDGAEPPGTN